MRYRSTLSCIASLVLLTAFARQARAYIPIAFDGGPVISPVIYPVFWGNWSSDGNPNNDPVLLTQYLTGLAAYLSGAPTLPGSQVGLEPVTRQYGVVGATVNTRFSQGTLGFTTINDASVYRMIAQLQAQGSLPPAGANRLFVMFLKGFQYDFSAQGNPCGYHQQHDGNYYAVIPWESSCSIQGLISHEVLESVTDPHPWSGWVTNEGFGGFSHSEGADQCGASTGMTFGSVSTFADNSTSSCQSFIYSTTPHFAVTKVAGHVLDVVWPTPAPATLAHAWFDGSTWQSETMVAPASQTTLNFVGPPAVVSASPNRIDVFARAVNGDLIHLYKDYGSGSGWTWTFKLAMGVGAPSAASYTTNRIDLAFMAWDARTGHSWSNDGGVSFATEYWSSRLAGSVKVVALKNEKLDVYVYGSNLRLNVNMFDNGWSGFRQVTSHDGYTGLTPGVATSDAWNHRAILLDFQKNPFGATLTSLSPYDGWQFWPAKPTGNTSWGALDVVGNAQGFDAAWQDWNEGTFYYSHYNMQANGWGWVADGHRWGDGVRLGGVYASPPVISYGGDGKIYVTGTGMDGCLYYTTVEGGAPNGPNGTGACNMY